MNWKHAVCAAGLALALLVPAISVASDAVAEATSAEDRWGPKPVFDPATQRHRRGNSLIVAGAAIPGALFAVAGASFLLPCRSPEFPCWFFPWMTGVASLTAVPLLVVPGALQSTRGATLQGASPPKTGLWIIAAGGLVEVFGTAAAIGLSRQSAPFVAVAGGGMILAGGLVQFGLNREAIGLVRVVPLAWGAGGGLGVVGTFR